MPRETICVYCEKPLLDAEHAKRHVLEQCEKAPARRYRTAALAARAYLAAHKGLVDAGTTPERPEAARRLAEAWLVLNKACAELPEESNG